MADPLTWGVAIAGATKLLGSIGQAIGDTTYKPNLEAVRDKYDISPHRIGDRLSGPMRQRFRGLGESPQAEGVLGRQDALRSQWESHLDDLRQRATGERSITRERGEEERRRMEGAMLASVGGRGRYNPALARQAYHGAQGMEQRMAAPLAASAAQEQAAAAQQYMAALQNRAAYEQGMMGSQMGFGDLARSRAMGLAGLESEMLNMGADRKMDAIRNWLAQNDIQVGRN